MIRLIAMPLLKDLPPEEPGHVCSVDDCGMRPEYDFSEGARGVRTAIDPFEAMDAYMAQKLDGMELDLGGGVFVILRTPQSLRDEVCGPG